MKKIVLFFLVFFNFLTIYSISAKEWSITQIKHVLPSYSANFSFNEDNSPTGYVTRTGLLCPRYYYDLFDTNNKLQARGITRFFSLGLFSAKEMDIDIYDSDNRYLGFIEGQFFTLSRAKFIISNNNNEPVAIAYLDSKKVLFLIVSASNEANILAKLTAESFGLTKNCEMTFNSCPEELKPILKIFTAFVVDYIENFQPPPKVIHHYHHHHHY